jgi:hypothetical protein
MATHLLSDVANATYTFSVARWQVGALEESQYHIRTAGYEYELRIDLHLQH